MTSTSAAHVAPRRPGGIAAGLAALVALMLLPAPAPITELGMARLGLLAFAVIWWIAAPFPLAFTTLAMLAIGILTGALTVNSAFAHSSSWVLWFVVGAFGMATALEATGVNRRFALAFLDITWVRGHPHRFLLMFLLSATVMSAFMANTVVSVIWLALAVKIYRLLDVAHDDPLVEANTLGIAWAANIGGIATPVGNGTNAPAIGLIASATGVTITFVQWTIVGSVLTLIFLATALLVFRFAVPKGSEAFARPETAAFIADERRWLGPMPLAEKLAIGWFLAAIVLWFVPDVSRYVASAETSAMLQRSLHLSVPALLVPIAMCLTPVRDRRNRRDRHDRRNPPDPPDPHDPRAPSIPERRTVLTWDEWMKGVDWTLVLFIGGVMALGTAVGEDATGIPDYVRTVLQPSVSGLSESTFVLLMCAGVILVTSLISNMVTLAVVMPLGLTLAQSLKLADPVALGMVLGIGPSLDYLLPSGTTTNAIVAGSGFLRVKTMVRYGAILFVIHTLLLAYIGYPLSKFVLGR